jgi:hypothetical protein
MVEGPKATVEAFNKAKDTPDTHVVFVGHSIESDSNHALGIELSDGASYGKQGSNYFPAGEGADAPPGMVSTTDTGGDPLSANSVALFGCNTFDLAPEYSGTNFTGVQSGPDGTNMETLDLAAAGWVTAGGGQAGVNAANGAIEGSQDKTDTGDNVESERSQ